MTTDLTAFLAGDRPEDVALYLADTFVDEPDRLATQGVRVSNGVVLVVEGNRGRNVFRSITGGDVMTFARKAGDQKGMVAADLSGGTCPETGDDANSSADATEHEVSFVFSFVEPQKENASDIYGDGDVIHAYARCTCGTAYSQKWVIGQRGIPG